MNYWNAKLQDDVYAIKASGYEVGREIEYEYTQKKAKDENGETISIDDTSKVKSFEGALIPREIIEALYFAKELAAINELAEQSAALEAELDEMREEESGDDGLLKECAERKRRWHSEGEFEQANQRTGSKKNVCCRGCHNTTYYAF